MSTRILKLEMEPGIIHDASKKYLITRFVTPFETKGLQCVGISCNESDDYTIFNLIFEAVFIEHHLYRTKVTNILKEFEEQTYFFMDNKNLYISLIQKH